MTMTKAKQSGRRLCGTSRRPACRSQGCGRPSSGDMSGDSEWCDRHAAVVAAVRAALSPKGNGRRPRMVT